METTEVFKYLLLFITLTSVQCKFKPYDWQLSKLCSKGEDIDDCGCQNAEGGVKKLQCGYSYNVEEYVSRIKKTYDIANVKFELKFGGLDTTIPPKIFDGFNIRRMEIDTCNVTNWVDQVQEPAFVGLENTLEFLDIKETIFQPSENPGFPDYKYEINNKLPFNVRHLRKLKSVKFYKNYLYAFCNMFGSGSEDSLEELDLEDNKVWHVCDGAFANQKRLRIVNLKNNKLTELSRGMFPSPATYLEDINLNENKLSVLPEDLFENMPALRFLYLSSNNEFYYLGENTFKPVWSQLTYFELRTCCVRCENPKNLWIYKVKRPEIVSGVCLDKNYKKVSFRDVIDEKLEVSE